MSNTIMLGDKSTKYKLGDSSVKAIYLGDTKVWSGALTQIESYNAINVSAQTWAASVNSFTTKVMGKDDGNLYVYHGDTASSCSGIQIYKFNEDSCANIISTANISFNGFSGAYVSAARYINDNLYLAVTTPGGWTHFSCNGTLLFSQYPTYSSNYRYPSPLITESAIYYIDYNDNCSTVKIKAYDIATSTQSDYTGWITLDNFSAISIYWIDDALYAMTTEYVSSSDIVTKFYKISNTGFTLINTVSVPVYDLYLSTKKYGIGNNNTCVKDGILYAWLKNKMYAIDIPNGTMTLISDYNDCIADLTISNTAAFYAFIHDNTYYLHYGNYFYKIKLS